MSGTTYILLGVLLMVLSFAGLAGAQFFLYKWKKRYDSEWEHSD